ncbi:hypothetical protein MMC09_005848 [Bachmanniomyces sp. S44760]|nr:hypothetical protein [Bachmanniomyces sp. S44760]
MKRVANTKGGPVSPPASKRKLESTTTNKAVANFFAPASKKEPKNLTWRIVRNSLLVGCFAPTPNEASASIREPKKRRKIAAFDFDSTLIKTSSGNVFGKDASDWGWWDLSVPSTLKNLYSDGYLVIVISNQGGISVRLDPKSLKSDQKRLADFKAKVTSVLSQLDFPISIYAATARDQYRKPRTGMWDEILEDYDLDVVDEGPDMHASLFVGDAGGRHAQDKVKADHSSSDRDFAANVGINFMTPEEYFLNEPSRPFTRSFEPSLHLLNVDDARGLTTSDDLGLMTASKPAVQIDVPSIVLFCGSPGIGKSTFYWKNFRPLGYERVNQDTLKTVRPPALVVVQSLS